ncbi:MAG: COP23 domain-containing protein [Pseudanabaena sp. ELA645]
MAVGKINGQSVICVTRQEGGDCSRDLKGEGLLITTRPGINPSKTLADLINVRMEAGSALTETRDLTRKTSINSVNTKCLIEASTQSSYDECVKGSPSAAGSVPRSSNPATPSKRPLW